MVSYVLLNADKNGESFGNGNAQLFRKKWSLRNPQLQYPDEMASSYMGVWVSTITAASFVFSSLSTAAAIPIFEKEFPGCSMTRCHRPG